MIPEKIGFIGLGHIGGSVAKTVHRIYPDIQIVAYDTCRATLDGIAEYQSNNIYQCYAVTEMGGKMITMIITGPADQGQTECEAVLASIQPTE